MSFSNNGEFIFSSLISTIETRFPNLITAMVFSRKDNKCDVLASKSKFLINSQGEERILCLNLFFLQAIEEAIRYLSENFKDFGDVSLVILKLKGNTVLLATPRETDLGLMLIFDSKVDIGALRVVIRNVLRRISSESLGGE